MVSVCMPPFSVRSWNMYIESVLQIYTPYPTHRPVPETLDDRILSGAKSLHNAQCIYPSPRTSNFSLMTLAILMTLVSLMTLASQLTLAILMTLVSLMTLASQLTLASLMTVQLFGEKQQNRIMQQQKYSCLLFHEHKKYRIYRLGIFCYHTLGHRKV